MARYWIHRDGRQLGPYDEARILDDYAKGVLLPTDQLWTEGMRNRVPVSEAFATLQAGAVGEPNGASVAMPPPMPTGHVEYGAAQPVYAGFWARWCAAWIDAMIAFAIVFALAFGPDLVAETVLKSAPRQRFVPLGLPISLAVVWVYFAGLESGRRRAALGKRAMGLEVRTADGFARIGFPRATVRWLVHWVSFALLLLGFLIQPFTPRKQALHDLASGTVVVVRAHRPPALIISLAVIFAIFPSGFMLGAASKLIEMLPLLLSSR